MEPSPVVALFDAVCEDTDTDAVLHRAINCNFVQHTPSCCFMGNNRSSTFVRTMQLWILEMIPQQFEKMFAISANDHRHSIAFVKFRQFTM